MEFSSSCHITDFSHLKGLFSSVHSSNVLYSPLSLSTVSHCFTPSCQQQYLMRVVCLPVHTPSLALHPLALSSWASVFSALPRRLLLRSLMTSVLSETVVTCPFLCHLMSKQHLTRMTASSSLSLLPLFSYHHTVMVVEVSPRAPFTSLCCRMIAEWQPPALMLLDPLQWEQSPDFLSVPSQ